MGKFLFCVTAKVLADLMENNYLPFSAKIQADPFVWILIQAFGKTISIGSSGGSGSSGGGDVLTP